MEYKGKKIVLFDFSHCTKEEIPPIVEEAKVWMSQQAPGSVLTLTDVSDTTFNSDTIEAMKGFTVHNKPFVKAAAVVGIRGLLKAVYNFVTYFSQRNIPIFETREKAMDWLVTQ